MTPITEGCDCLGPTLRQHERPNGQPAKLQITPSKASVQGLKTQVQALCKPAVGATPARPGSSSASTPCYGVGHMTIGTSSVPKHVPNWPVVCGVGCLDGPNTATRIKRAVG